MKKKEERFFTSDEELSVPSPDRSKKSVANNRSPVKRKNVLFDSEDSLDEGDRAPSRRDSMYQRLGATLLDTEDEDEETLPKTKTSKAPVFHLIKESAALDLFKMKTLSVDAVDMGIGNNEYVCFGYDGFLASQRHATR